MKKLSLALVTLMTVMVLSVAATEHEDTLEIPGDKEVVVLLHGLGRSNAAMWLLAARLEDAGFYVQRVGYSSLTQTPQEILADVTQQIETCCAKYERTVHFVGHSFGGLLIRAYLQNNKPASLGRVVLLGTPNQGSEIVDVYRDRWWMKLAGPTTLSLGTTQESFPNTLNDPDYSVGVIAGSRKQNGFTSEILPGQDDGLVSVSSAKLNGMRDFIVVETNHGAMRYNSVVAEQTIAFLKNGRFKDE